MTMAMTIKQPTGRLRQHLPDTRHRPSMLMSAVLTELLAGHALVHPDPGASMTELLVLLVVPLVGTTDVVRTANK